MLACTERDHSPCADVSRAVKEYSRPAADKEFTRACNLRPPSVLLKTVCYLVDDIAASSTFQPWTEVYSFVSDRLRSVRQDMIIQRVSGPDCVAVLEKSVRFLLYASYRLCGQPLQYYDPRINDTHLQESLSWLLENYRDGKHRHQEEFQALSLLYNLDVGCWSYEVGRKLGEGGFGSVYAGTRLKDGLKVALKFADTVGIEWINIEDNPEPVPLEISLLILANKGPRVPQIIQLLDWDEEPNRYIMVLEFPTPCESLIEYLDRHDYYIDENVAKVIMLLAAVAAQTCCQRGVLHRDIKLENLLINPETLDVKLIDFGCGEILTDRGYTSFAGLYYSSEL